MFEAFKVEVTDRGDTLAHYLPAGGLPRGYVAFSETAARRKVRAVLWMPKGCVRVSQSSWMKSAPRSAVYLDFTDPLLS